MVLSKNFKGTEVQYKDVASSEDNKKSMRDGMGDPKGLPPQIFNGESYCGVSMPSLLLKSHALLSLSVSHLQNFESFDNAIEEDSLEEFLKLK